MKKIFGLIIAASTLVGFTACSDFLDEDNKTGPDSTTSRSHSLLITSLLVHSMATQLMMLVLTITGKCSTLLLMFVIMP